MRISAVIITFNEARHIADAIRSVDWTDEIVVVDSDSTDETRAIASGLGAKVITNPWPGFSAQKQFAVQQASNDWILSLDADERISTELKEEIRRLQEAAATADGYRIPRLSYYAGQPIRHGGWYPDHQLRLFDRRKGGWNGAVIHESIKMDGDARVGTLTKDIHHYTVDDAAHHERMIVERYAPLGAQKMFEEGRRTSPLWATLSALFSFTRAYFLKLGLLDGMAGLRIAYYAGKNTFLKHKLLIDMHRNPGAP